MKRVNVLLDIILIGVGLYLTMTDPAAKTLGIILVLAGITSRITERFSRQRNRMMSAKERLKFVVDISLIS